MRQARNLEPEEPDTFSIEAIDQFIEQFKAIAAGMAVLQG